MQHRTIDVHCLEALGACESQVKLFRRRYGEESVRVTVRSMTAANAAGISIWWLASTLSYSALAEYNKIRSSAWAKYNKARIIMLVRVWNADSA